MGLDSGMEKAAIKEVERHIKDIDTRYATHPTSCIHTRMVMNHTPSSQHSCHREKGEEIAWCMFPLYHSQAMSPGDAMAMRLVRLLSNGVLCCAGW